MYVYGGPTSQTVLDDYGGDRYLWHQMLARKGVIVVSVDNRGTGARGSAFRHIVVRASRACTSPTTRSTPRSGSATQRWVDPARIGIWGWSYGGYMTAMSAFRGGSLFRAAISVAPVTDWRLYDNIYTERYMRTPAENADGYARGRAAEYVQGLTASYLLVHGTGDDNVHPQNSIQLVDKLEAANKQFQFMVYPGRTHAISGGNSRTHLFTLLTNFVEQTLGAARAAHQSVRRATGARRGAARRGRVLARGRAASRACEPATGATLPRTRAERTSYAETSTYADVIAFIDSLQHARRSVSRARSSAARTKGACSRCSCSRARRCDARAGARAQPADRLRAGEHPRAARSRERRRCSRSCAISLRAGARTCSTRSC